MKLRTICPLFFAFKPITIGVSDPVRSISKTYYRGSFDATQYIGLKTARKRRWRLPGSLPIFPLQR